MGETWVQLNRFDLNLLVALDALLREKSVTRAAARVCLSQPAMSGALGRLRVYFEDPLLVRVGHELELTPRARALVQPVRESLCGIRATLETQPIFDPATLRRSFVGMVPDFVSPLLIPRLMKRITAAASGVRLQFKHWSQDGAARLALGDLEFFIALDNPRLLRLAKHAEPLQSQELQRIHWVCVAATDHPTLRDELTHEQYLSLPHVYVRTPGELLPVDEAAEKQLGLTLDIRITTESVLEVPFMLAGTSLIAILPQPLAAILQPSAAINIFPLPEGLKLRGRINLLWHKRSEADPGHAWLRALILEAASVRP
jgi:DNA-binding transcriptional LysR family regulator